MFAVLTRVLKSSQELAKLYWARPAGFNRFQSIMPPKRKASKRATKQESEPVENKMEEDEGEEVKMPVKRKRGRPAKAGAKRPLEEVDGEEGVSESSTAKKSKESSGSQDDNNGVESKPPPPGLKKVNSNFTDVSELDCTSSATSKGGKPWTMKFSSWNVNGVRAWLKNNGFEYLKKELPDIFCLQETKCDEGDLPHAQLKLEGYESYWSSAEQKGYSGTGLYSKQKPLNVTYGIGVEEHDTEGRVITAEYDSFYYVTTYIPNSGDKLKRLKYRVDKWDPAFRQYLKSLDDKKPVILCGDLNVAHHPIDLANPKGNLKTSGFTVEERESFSTLLEENKLIDSFRHLYPEKKDAYSYWSYRSNARKNNKGWRLDYFLVSERIADKVCDHVIRSEVLGSDHCPVVLLMEEL